MTERENIQQFSFHQRSHSMPLDRRFIRNGDSSYQSLQEIEYRSNNFNSTYKSSRQDSKNTDDFINTPSKVPYRSTVSSDSCESEFFFPSSSLVDVFDKNDTLCPVSLNCKLSKGFFKSESHWTCYRRNYFQVTASLSIPKYSGIECYNLGPRRQPIKQFLIGVRACIFGDNGQHSNVRLSQLTPKRDKGPIQEPPMIPICPTNYVTFERLQFKVATANNGRRKASQQFFCLIIEASAQLEDETMHVISTCRSMPLVVRGRSPGHYNCETGKKGKSPSKEDSERTLPIPVPNYVYSSPTISDTSTSAMTIPQLIHSLNHGRSQSANDPQFMAKHRKYQVDQQSLFHNDSMASIDRALKQWELQAATYRESAFHSYIPEDQDSEASTPYNNTLNHDNEDDRPFYPRHDVSSWF